MTTVPLETGGQYGLAIAHCGDYSWLTNPAGVWRASLVEQSLELTSDIVSLKVEARPEDGLLAVELRNDEGQYNVPGDGELSVLDIGCQVELGIGYVTSQGNEVSMGLAYWLEAYEHISRGGKSTLILYANDGWWLIESWRARHQFRWNQGSDEMSVKDILSFVLSRVGLRLDVKSQSSIITGYYPDFTIHPADGGDNIVRRLLSFVPDVLFIEGNDVYIVNPQSSDSSEYAYGLEHTIIESRYHKGALSLNRVRVEGYDPSEDEAIIVDSFYWDQISNLHDRLALVNDTNINSVARAEERGEAYLREAEIKAVSGVIRVPVNCGQQLYDVIDITDGQAGLSQDRKRVMAITLGYYPDRSEYEQRLSLGAV